jgi:hypothetical protein
MIKFYFVGALTIKTYAYSSRSWELIQKFEVINYLDIFGSKIEVSLKSGRIFKITSVIKPNTLFDKNYLISDYSRFLINDIKYLDLPYLNINNNLKFLNNYSLIFNINMLAISWGLALIIIISKYINNIFLFQKRNVILTEVAGIGDVFNNYFINYYTSLLTNNNNIDDLLINESFQDLFFNLNNVNSLCLININLRYQNPLLLLKFQQFNLLNKFKIYYFGFKNFISSFDFNTLECIFLGNQVKDYYNLLIGKSRSLVIYFNINENINKILILCNKINKDYIKNKNFTFYTIFDDLNYKTNSNLYDLNNNKITFIINNNIHQLTKITSNFDFLVTPSKNINLECKLILPSINIFECQNFYYAINGKYIYSLNIPKIQKFSLSIREVLFCIFRLLFSILDLNIKYLNYLKLLNYIIIPKFNYLNFINIIINTKLMVFFKNINIVSTKININLYYAFHYYYCPEDYTFNTHSFAKNIIYKKFKAFEFFKSSNNNIFLDLDISTALVLVIKNLILLHKNFISII